MKILVAYATNSSGTLVASHTIVNTLKEKGYEVFHKDIRDVKKEALSGYDLIILGSPSWNYNKTEGQPHEFMSAFMQSIPGKTLMNKNFAVFGLGDTAYMQFCGAVDYIEDFVNRAGGKLIVPSLRVDGFFFDQTENEKRLMAWTESVSQKIQPSLKS